MITFEPAENQWQRLLRRLARESAGMQCADGDKAVHTLEPLLANQVLTVLADISRKRLDGYDESYAHSRGTMSQLGYAKKLTRDVAKWIASLRAFILRHQKAGTHDSKSAKVAQQLLDILAFSLPKEGDTPESTYHNMLQAVKSIQKNADTYLEQIETAGDTDGAMSLLISFLKNHSKIADSFNKRISQQLQQLYFNEIIHLEPEPAVQGKAYVVVKAKQNLTLKAGAGFLVGKNSQDQDLIYSTVNEESVTPMVCSGVRTITPLQSTGMALGWELSSPMLVLRQGERTIEARLHFTDDSQQLLPENIVADAFSAYISTDYGWHKLKVEKAAIEEKAALAITMQMEKGDAETEACSEEVHGAPSQHPVLLILSETNKQDWAWISRAKITKADLIVVVKGMRDFTLYNEFGEANTRQPFLPFGLQGEQGSWFMFGSEELGLKPLKNVHLKGEWQKIPNEKWEINQIYEPYGEDAESFAVKTRWQKGGRWLDCGDAQQKLFSFSSNGQLQDADIVFDFEWKPAPSKGLGAPRYEYSQDKDGFFKAVLQTPSIGFGEAAYRRLFTQTMIYNSQAKKKHQKELPLEPLRSMLADLEICYEASSVLDSAPQAAFYDIESKKALPFRVADIENASVYFAIDCAKGQKAIRLYLDLALRDNALYESLDKYSAEGKVSWSFCQDGHWHDLEADNVSDETHGLMQSGYVEIEFPDAFNTDETVWLRACHKGDFDTCLDIKNAWANCVLTQAANGDEEVLPAGTITEFMEANEPIAEVSQLLPSFGGKKEQSMEEATAKFPANASARRHAVNAKDFELLATNLFPEIEKAICIASNEGKRRMVTLMLFARNEDNSSGQLAPCRLSAIECELKKHCSPFVNLHVANYRKDIELK